MPIPNAPRLCAHRGMNQKAPENTLPAFAMAIACGAKEIELDLWPAKDGSLVVCHDPTVDRTTSGTGAISQLAYADLRRLDAGCKFSPAFQNTRLPLFQEVLEQLGLLASINLHIKSTGQPLVHSPIMIKRGQALSITYTTRALCLPPLPKGVEQVLPEIEQRPVTPYPPQVLDSILKLLQQYNCTDQVYITGEKDVLLTAQNLAPEIPRCCLEGHMNYSIVENAVLFGCKRVQFCKTLVTEDMIRRAKANSLHCNLFWSDDPTEAQAYFDLGIDTLLTNDYDIMEEAGLASENC